MFFNTRWKHLIRPTPHLVLSIIGGAKNFRLDGRKKDIFKRGLIGAALWIVINPLLIY